VFGVEKLNNLAGKCGALACVVRLDDGATTYHLAALAKLAALGASAQVWLAANAGNTYGGAHGAALVCVSSHAPRHQCSGSDGKYRAATA